MQHEKKKMTRAEAIIMLRKHVPFATDSEKIIDFYIEAGMLEIVEEKEPITLCGESVSWNWWLQQKPEFKAEWVELLYLLKLPLDLNN